VAEVGLNQNDRSSSVEQFCARSAKARELAGRFDLDYTCISVGGRDYELIHPRSVDDLISDEDFDRDERIPYWANIWPSERILAEVISQQRGAGRKLLELGCGVGFAALVAAHVGFDVLATDYYHEAIEFARVNADENQLSVAARMMDWRDLPANLGKFDYVIAADVLYEKPMARFIADVLVQTLAADGVAYVADPCRTVAKSFRDRCSERGLSFRLHLETLVPFPPSDVVVEVYELRRAR